MYKIVAPNYIKKNPYFWYTVRSFEWLQKQRIAEITYSEDSCKTSKYIATIFINDTSCIFDVRDDMAMPIEELKDYPNALIFKSNFSSELWDNPPETLENKLIDEAKQYRSQVRLFIFGRALGLDYNRNELEFFAQFTKHPIKYDVTSLMGAGLFAQHTNSRIKLLNLTNEVFGDRAKLILKDREHNLEKHKIQNWENYLSKYEGLKCWHNKFPDYADYLNFVSMGRFSISCPGIDVSMPFRIIDAIFDNCCIISTKIWQDVYKTFNCIELPICGYFGFGDWENAKEILKIINNVDYDLMRNKNKEWYNHYLSAEGFWQNQIVKGLNQ